MSVSNNLICIQKITNRDNEDEPIQRDDNDEDSTVKEEEIAQNENEAQNNEEVYSALGAAILEEWDNPPENEPEEEPQMEYDEPNNEENPSEEETQMDVDEMLMLNDDNREFIRNELYSIRWSEERRDLLGVRRISSTEDARKWIEMERSHLREKYRENNDWIARRSMRTASGPMLTRRWRRYIYIINDLLRVGGMSENVRIKFWETWIDQNNSDYWRRRLLQFRESQWIRMWQLILDIVISLVNISRDAGASVISILFMELLCDTLIKPPENIKNDLEMIQVMLREDQQWTASERVIERVFGDNSGNGDPPSEEEESKEDVEDDNNTNEE